MFENKSYYELRDDCWAMARRTGEICVVIGSLKKARKVMPHADFRPNKSKALYWVSFPNTTFKEHSKKIEGSNKAPAVVTNSAAI